MLREWSGGLGRMPGERSGSADGLGDPLAALQRKICEMPGPAMPAGTLAASSRTPSSR
jgi:hypothetical protein